ncbi:MAG: LysM domain-containing protein [Lactobacillaceae bacterium]|jgi:LysM repeat protein|nr:LysM domain-containing protein [Lactobacillaceae bacterium]
MANNTGNKIKSTLLTILVGLVGFIVVAGVAFGLTSAYYHFTDDTTPSSKTSSSKTSSSAKSTSKKSSSAKKASTQDYTIQSGDTATAVAATFGISLEKLKALNPGLDVDGLIAGETIKVSGTAAKASSSTEASSTDTDADTTTEDTAASTIVVAQGQTLYSIANANGLTQAQLEALNPGVTADTLQAGQTLNIK